MTLQHSPANMGYLFLALFYKIPGVTWGSAFAWNLIPASIGNLIGGVVFVGGVMYFLHHPTPAELHSVRHQLPLVGTEDSTNEEDTI
jgi:formate/nitrite transporter FocA (FNT family)